MPVQKQGPFVSTLLRDEALLWYRSTYEKWDPKTPLTWEIFRTAMHEHFAPPNEDRRLQDEWANLRQQGTVFEYVSVLAIRIPGLSQTVILDKFIRRLKSKTRIEVPRVVRPKDTRRALSIGRSIRQNCLQRKEHQFSYAKLQPLLAHIQCERHGPGLRRTHAY